MLLDSFRMALRFQRGNVRLALTVVALACGVALVCAIDLVNGAVFRAFTEVIDTMAGRAALQVTAGQSGLFPEEIAEKVAAVTGVELAVPVVSATAFTTDESGDLLTVHGVEVTNEKAVRVYESRDAGGLDLGDPLEFLNQADSVVLTREFAAQRGIEPGQTIALMTPTGRHEFTVRGLLEPQGVGRVYGGRLVVMDLWAAEQHFARPGYVNRLDVVPERGADVATVANAIRAVLPDGLTVEAPDQRKADLQKVLRSLQLMLQGMGILAVVAAVLVVFNRLAAVFEARSWQLGVLQAVGMTRRAVCWELVKESVLLGLMGVGVGIVAGSALARALLPILARTTAIAFSLVAPEAEMHVSPGSLVIAAVVGVGASVVAALLPAWRASKVSVAESIRGRGREQSQVEGAAYWLPRLLTMAGVVAAVALQRATDNPLWGLAATFLIVALTALSARPIVALVMPHVGILLQRLGGPCGRMASAALLRNPRRVSLTAATLGVGLGTSLWFGILAKSFEQTVTSTLERSIRADLLVSSQHIAAGFLEGSIDRSLLDELRKIDGVRAAAGDRTTSWQYEDGPIAIHSFDSQYLRDPAFGELVLSGDHAPDAHEVVAGGRGIFVASNFEHNLGKHLGDVVTLETPTGPLSLPIVGVTMDFASPRGTVHMSREVYEQHWQDRQLTHAFVALAPGVDAEEVRLEIERRLGRRYGLRVLSSAAMIDYFAAQVRRAFSALDVLSAMVLLVVLAGVSDTLAAAVVERTRDIGVIRAAGIRRWQVRRIILEEGAALALLGLVLAAVAGTTLGALWVWETFPLLLGWDLRLHVPYGNAIAVALLTLAICLAAGVVPARRASRLQPAEAIRYE